MLKEQPQLQDDVTAHRLKKTSKEFANVFSPDPIELPLAEGGTFEMPMLDLGKFVYFLAEQSVAFRSLLASCFAKCPCSPVNPWDAILYFDECTPGNALRPDNRRKMLAVYFTFRNFGPEALHKQAAWLPICYLRHTVLTTVAGKLSGVVRHVLRRLLLGDDSPSQRGVLVNGIAAGGRPGLIFFRMSNLLYDEEACNAAWGFKGASGLVPCAYCKNVHGVADWGEPLLCSHDDTNTLVDVSCPDPNRFDARSPGDLWFAVDLLAELHLRGELPKYVMDDKAKHFGVNHAPWGLPADIELRRHVSLASHTYDPAHCLIINGIAQVELSLLFVRLASAGLTMGAIRRLAKASWSTCHSLRTHASLDKIFSQAREKHFSSSKRFSCGASEVLSAVPMLRFFLDVQCEAFQNDFKKDVASFHALAKVISLYVAAKRGERVANDWARALYDHAICFHAAYGDDKSVYIPKFHYCRHLPWQMLRDGVCLDALVTERYHKQSLAVANNIVNTSAFETSVLSRVLQQHLHLARCDPLLFASGLEAPAEFDVGVQISKYVVISGVRIREGDIVKVHGVPHYVRGGVQTDSALHLLANPFSFLRRVTSASSCWARGSALVLLEVAGATVKLQALWSVQEDGTFLLVDMA